MTGAGDGRSGTLVLGLGNPVRYDDGVGLRVADAVRELLEREPLPGVCVSTSTRAGFELLDLVAGVRHVVIIDCVVTPDAVPGRVRRLTLDEVAGSARLVGAHDITLKDALALGCAAGLEMPGIIEIYGVEAADIDRIEEGLSPAVAAAVPVLAEEIHRLLSARA